MAEVVIFPGAPRRDVTEDVPLPDVMQNAVDAGVSGTIIIGTARDGELFIASENGDVDAVVGKLMRAVTFLSSCELVDE